MMLKVQASDIAWYSKIDLIGTRNNSRFAHNVPQESDSQLRTKVTRVNESGQSSLINKCI